MADVLFYSEEDDLLHELAGLATSVAAQAGGRSCAVVLGEDMAATASSLASEGVSEVYLFKAPAAVRAHPEAATQAMAEASAKHDSAFLLVGSTKEGKVVAGRLAATLGAPAASDCATIQLIGGDLVVERPSYGGRVTTKVALSVCRSLRQSPGLPQGYALRHGGQSERDSLRAGADDIPD
ncbi:MAG: hypothetical protein ABSG92_11185 [Conexivisphaerales archaeon]